MHRQIILVVCVALLSCLLSRANACTWEGLSPENVARELPTRVTNADTIVHGRVLSIGKNDFSARIKVLRSFKGKADILDLESGMVCGHIFKVGEENIYFIKNLHVGSPTVYAVSDWLVAALTKTEKSK